MVRRAACLTERAVGPDVVLILNDVLLLTVACLAVLFFTDSEDGGFRTFWVSLGKYFIMLGGLAVSPDVVVVVVAAVAAIVVVMLLLKMCAF